MQNRTDQVTARRDGLREILGSRGVQALLAAVALVQVGVTARGGVAAGGMARWEQDPAPAAAAAHPVIPAGVVTRLALGTPAEPEEAPVDETAEKAQALAEKYKEEGYPVTAELAESIAEAAEENDIDLEMAFGLVRAESGFRNSATSHVGAVGLTQLMPRTARWLEPGTTVRDLRDSETNLKIGFGYLRQLIDKYEGNERLALLAYNRGPGTVDRVLRRGGDPNNGYVEKVMAD